MLNHGSMLGIIKLAGKNCAFNSWATLVLPLGPNITAMPTLSTLTGRIEFILSHRL